jgi:16S rRNA (uracil1498-N3)-methyltransferase
MPYHDPRTANRTSHRPPPRFFVASPLPVMGACAVTGDAAHRIARVLRMAPGQAVRLFDGTGREVEAAIGQTRGGTVTASITLELPPGPRRPELHLYQALIRPNRYEWLLEKATELGAAAITPVVSERCQVRPAELGPSRAARWVRIAVEAAEQCGRRTLPRLGEPAALSRALEEAPGLLVLPWEEARDEAAPLGDVLRRQDPRPAALSLFIGPEGGFSIEEVEAARVHGAVVVSLGPWVLRAETAALAALAIAVDGTTPPPTPPRDGEGRASC